ncbi:MAG: hypothetical protein M3R24_16920 [Chloroflexota bacterium]|nr:hypothetical protein [Chloroflexota bacterium]
MKYRKAYTLEQALRHRRGRSPWQHAPHDADIATLVAVAEDIRACAPPAPDAQFVDRLALLLAATPAASAPRRQHKLRSLAWPRFALGTSMAALLVLVILSQAPHARVAQFVWPSPATAITAEDAKERVAVAFAALAQPQLSQAQQLALISAYTNEVQVALRTLPPSELPAWADHQRHQILALEGRLDATMIAMLLKPLPQPLAVTRTPTTSVPTLSVPTATTVAGNVVISGPTSVPTAVQVASSPTTPPMPAPRPTGTDIPAPAPDTAKRPSAAPPCSVPNPQPSGSQPAVSRPAPTRTPLPTAADPGRIEISPSAAPPVHDTHGPPPAEPTAPAAAAPGPSVPASQPAAPPAPAEPLITATPSGEDTAPAPPVSAPANTPEAPAAPPTEAPAVPPTEAPTAPSAPAVPTETTEPQEPPATHAPPEVAPTAVPGPPPLPAPSEAAPGEPAPGAPPSRAPRQP